MFGKFIMTSRCNGNAKGARQPITGPSELHSNRRRGNETTKILLL